MKIKEFAILRYGPLPNRGRISLDDFNLLFGKNEEGKTLTIDALVKLLLGKRIKDFEKINRVEEIPEGYIVLEDEENNEIKLTKKNNLTGVTGLTSSECRNIFIIRDSDISINAENEFYTNLTDKLTGLRAEEISNIKKILLEMGQITPGGSFKDDSKSQKLKSRLEGTNTLIERINVLSEKIKNEKLDELEEELVECSEKIKEIKKIMKNLESARKRKKFEEGEKALCKLNQLIQEVEALSAFNDEDLQIWRDCERDTQKLKEDENKLQKDFNKKQQNFRSIVRKIQEKERDFLIFQERKKKIDDEVRIELKNIEIKEAELAQQRGKNSFFTKVSLVSLGAFSISLVSFIITGSRLLYIPIILFSFLPVFILFFKYQFIKDRAWLEGAFERVKSMMSKFNMSSDNLEEINSKIQQFDEDYYKEKKALDDIRTEKEVMKNDKDRVENELSDIKEKISKNKDEIDKLKETGGAESLQEYLGKFKLKQEKEKMLRDQKAVLESHFEKTKSILKENIPFWNGKIKELAIYKDKSKEIEYKESLFSRIENEEKRYEKRYDELSERFLYLKKELEEIEREANKLIKSDTGFLYCRTLVDLNAIHKRLQEFINAAEKNRDTVLNAKSIFEEIEVEERERVAELFGKDSKVSGYFHKITDGIYEEVQFDQKTEKIEIRQRNGKILSAEKLSGGAYDQLYLSIRLALGEKILKGKKGFFIMDDPFIKADPDRLKKQFEMVKNIANIGWQVIYFSAKGEVADILNKDIKEGLINCVEFQGDNCKQTLLE